MKNGFSKLAVRALALASVTVVCQASIAGDSFKDGTLPTAVSGHTSNAAGHSGRAQLRIEDLKTLLGLSTCDPSSADAPSDRKEAVDGLPHFFLSLSKYESNALSRKVHSVEAARSMLQAQVLKETELKKMELRKARREIQMSRMSAQPDKEAALGKALYESILAESNLEAQLKTRLEAFDASNAILLEFVELSGSRHIEAIHIGSTQVWSSDSNLSVAQK